MKNTKWSLAASLAGSMMVSLLPGRSGAENPSSGKPRPQTVIDQSGDTSSKIFQRASLISRPLTSNQSAEAFSHRPLSFEPNLGQIDSNVKFLSRNDAYNVALTQTGSVVSLAVGEGSTPNRDPSHLNVSRMPTPQPRKYSPLSMSLVGANAKAEIKGEDVMQAQTNYLFGTNKKEWRTGIPPTPKLNTRISIPESTWSTTATNRNLNMTSSLLRAQTQIASP